MSRKPARPHLELLEDRSLPSGGSFTVRPVVPVIDADTKFHLRTVLGAGLQQGNRPDVFAKAGDSITANPNFLTELGSPAYNPGNPAVVGRNAGLATTVHFFRGRAVDGTGANSFSRVSAAAAPGWTSGNVLAAIDAELQALRPSIVLIMAGTNDVILNVPPAVFQASLAALAQTALARGVIPVLSTIPDIFFGGGLFEPWQPLYNQIIADVADALDVPLWNYWLALQPLPNHGLDVNGVHPSTSPLGSGNLTDLSLAYGYNVRNLTALAVLDKLLAVVLADGTPDGGERAIQPATVRFLEGLYAALLHRGLDPSGLSTWGFLLEHGLPRQHVARALEESAEHRGLQVDEFYATFLGRAPDQGGRAHWVGQFLAGATQDQVRERILTSAEYLERHADDAALVEAVYLDVLGEGPDAQRRDAWLTALARGLGRAEFVRSFLASADTQEEVVHDLYVVFLERESEDAEEGYWVGLLRQGRLTEEGVLADILASDEFRALQG